MKLFAAFVGVLSLTLLGGWLATTFDTLYSPLESSRQQLYGTYTSHVIVLGILSENRSRGDEVTRIQEECLSYVKRYNNLSLVSNRRSPLPKTLDATSCFGGVQ